MVAILNIIMYEDCRNQWSMSRPLLPLLLLNEEVCFESRTVCLLRTDLVSCGVTLFILPSPLLPSPLPSPLLPLPSPQYFQTFRSNVISVQLPVKQPAMVACFDSLMDGIEYNLLQKNRDRLVPRVARCGDM